MGDPMGDPMGDTEWCLCPGGGMTAPHRVLAAGASLPALVERRMVVKGPAAALTANRQDASEAEEDDGEP